MGNQIMDNNKSKNCFKLFSEDCFNALYDTSIMADNGIHHDMDENRIAFRHLNNGQREMVVDSLSEIMDYSQDFNKIGKYYLVRIDEPISRKILAQKIKTEFKYNHYKARLFALIKVILIIFQLYVSIINIIAKNKYTNIKFKIFRHKIDALFILKIFYFSCYDFIYIT